MTTEMKLETKRNYPKKGEIYTYEQISNLYLRDSPSLGFTYQGTEGCIQNSHLTEEELLSVPGMKESKWVYICETHEWIPCFQFATNIDQPPIDTLVDLEMYKDEYKISKEPWWWAIPKGFPRNQNE